jgi:hypothetical protein
MNGFFGLTNACLLRQELRKKSANSISQPHVVLFGVLTSSEYPYFIFTKQAVG